MNFSYWGYIAAPLTAATVSVIELRINRERGLYKSAFLLCVLYVTLDVVAALILFTPMRAGAELLRERPTMAAAIVSGLFAPSVMRTNIRVPFSKGRYFFSAAAMLRRLHFGVDHDIEEVCGASQSGWILDHVLPTVAILTVSELEDWAIEAIRAKLDSESQRSKRDECIESIKQMAADGSSEADLKHLIIQIIMDQCGRRYVVALLRRAKKKTDRHQAFPLRTRKLTRSDAARKPTSTNLHGLDG